MSLKLRANAGCLIAIASLFLFFGQVSAQTTCPNPGERLTQPSDAVVLNGTLNVGVCYNPNGVGINQQSEQAIQDLSGMRCNTSVNVANLDPKFAQCADKFMQQVRQMSGGACVNSAYRSVSQQLSACMGICGASSCPGKCAAPGTSYHQKGLAIDVSPSGMSAQQLWTLASQNGIGNPTSLHSSDPFHIQAATLNCSDSNFTPSNSDFYTPAAASPSTPTSGLTNALRNVFSPQPVAQPAPITPAPPITPASPLTPTSACTPQYSCTNGTVYYQSNSCTTSVFQTCPNGCSGTTCALSSTTISTAPSALSLLQQLAGPTVSSSTATTTPLSLNSNIYTIVQGALGIQSGATSTTPTQVPQYPVYASQTFTSNDISGSGYASQSYTPLQQLLVSLKTALVSVLPYLQPFGGQSPVPVYAE